MHELNALKHEDRVQLSRLIIALLDSWGVEPQDQIALLGLPEETTPQQYEHYRWDTPLPQDEAVMERVEHLIGIADALRTSYPHNANMGAIWMNRPNPRFDGRTPLAAMLEDGLEGIVAVRVHLDCAYDWDISSKAPETQPAGR
jgi:hypothetical protein